MRAFARSLARSLAGRPGFCEGNCVADALVANGRTRYCNTKIFDICALGSYVAKALRYYACFKEKFIVVQCIVRRCAWCQSSANALDALALAHNFKHLGLHHCSSCTLDGPLVHTEPQKILLQLLRANAASDWYPLPNAAFH